MAFSDPLIHKTADKYGTLQLLVQAGSCNDLFCLHAQSGTQFICKGCGSLV